MNNFQYFDLSTLGSDVASVKPIDLPEEVDLNVVIPKGLYDELVTSVKTLQVELKTAYTKRVPVSAYHDLVTEHGSVCTKYNELSATYEELLKNTTQSSRLVNNLMNDNMELKQRHTTLLTNLSKVNSELGAAESEVVRLRTELRAALEMLYAEDAESMMVNVTPTVTPALPMVNVTPVIDVEPTVVEVDEPTETVEVSKYADVSVEKSLIRQVCITIKEYLDCEKKKDTNSLYTAIEGSKWVARNKNAVMNAVDSLVEKFSELSNDDIQFVNETRDKLFRLYDANKEVTVKAPLHPVSFGLSVAKKLTIE